MNLFFLSVLLCAAVITSGNAIADPVDSTEQKNHENGQYRFKTIYSEKPYTIARRSRRLVGCFDGNATHQEQYGKKDIPHKVTALKCVYLADYSYEEYNKVQEKINSMSTKFNFDHLKVTKDLHTSTNDADTQGFVAIDKTNCEVFIVFRGSESIQDYKNNLDLYGSSEMSEFGEKGTDDYAVFLPGYNKALLSVYDSIVKPAVVDALREGMKVYFVGHSLGGILATMAAIRTYHENYNNTKYAKNLYLFVYGCPRGIGGGWKFYGSNNKVKAHSYNIKIENDIISNCKAMSGFESPDKVYNLGKVRGFVKPHYMSSYIKKLEDLANDVYNNNIPARDPTLIVSSKCERKEQVGCSAQFPSWCWIRCNPDNYNGWCYTRQLDLSQNCNYTLCAQQQDNLSCGDNACS
ncbi:uncharacterized protein [Dysidea avara]|uniref:uncharacterized protein n=1 Tax=Dysidea avara TaxID=196820 RepID=UPI003327D4D7